MNKVRIVVLLTLALLYAPGFAEVYRWVDSEGNVHYTQEKPRDHEAQTVNVPTVPPPTSTQDVNRSYLEQLDEQAQAKDQQQKRLNEQASKSDFNAQQCDTARKNLSTLQAGGRIAYVNAGGETVTITEEEKASRIAEAQKQIQFFCE